MRKMKWNRGLLAGILSLAMILTTLQLPMATEKVYADEPVTLTADASELVDGTTYKIATANDPLVLNNVLYVPISADVTIDLNGMILDVKDGSCGIIVNGRLTITDTSTGVTHKFDAVSETRTENTGFGDEEVLKAPVWQLNEANGEFTIIGGAIYGANHFCDGTTGACADCAGEGKKAYGGAIRVNGSGTLIMEGGNIVGNKVTDPCYGGNGFSNYFIGGAAVSVKPGAIFTMNGGTIQGNAIITKYDHTWCGKGAAIVNEGTVYIGADAKISNNSGLVDADTTVGNVRCGDNLGGAIANFAGATLENRGEISYNSIGGGGGVWNIGTATNYGKICHNNSNGGGGVFNGENATFTNKEGGLINENMIWAANGGGVRNDGVFNNYGCINKNTIADCANEFGGSGVYNYNKHAKFYNNGQINENIVINNKNGSWGGGVLNSGGAYLQNGENGQINGNIVKSKRQPRGGGVYNLWPGSEIHNYGQINDNKLIITEPDSVYSLDVDDEDYIESYSQGGGVCIYFGTLINYQSGQINGNMTSEDAVSMGGGIFTLGGGDILCTNYGSIRGNKATYGGGVFIGYEVKDFKVGGNCQIDGNLDMEGNKDNVTVIVEAEAKITEDDLEYEYPGLSMEQAKEVVENEAKEDLENIRIQIDSVEPLTAGAKIGVNVLGAYIDAYRWFIGYFPGEGKGVITKNYNTTLEGVDAHTYFFADSDTHDVQLNEAGEVEIINKANVPGGSGTQSGGQPLIIIAPASENTDDEKAEDDTVQEPEQPVDAEQEAAKHAEEVKEDLKKKVSEKEAAQIRTSVPTSEFTKLKPVIKKNTKTSVTLNWKKETDADGYMIYGNKCNHDGHKYKLELLKTVDATKLDQILKSLNQGTYYKYQIVAYKLVNGERVAIAKTPVIHTTTKGGDFGVAKAVRIDKVAGKKLDSEDAVAISLKAGKTAKIRATEVNEDKPIRHHRGLIYESSDESIATVDKKGKITAKKKGTCEIYVYAQNGVYNTITLKIK